MAGASSDHLEAAWGNAVLRNTPYSSPATVYLALHTASPGETGSGAEVSGSGYARQSVAFGAPTDGVFTNSAQKTFTAAGGNFGTVTHIGIWDNSSGGNLLYYGALTTPKTVKDGDSIVFAATTGIVITIT